MHGSGRNAAAWPQADRRSGSGRASGVARLLFAICLCVGSFAATCGADDADGPATVAAPQHSAGYRRSTLTYTGETQGQQVRRIDIWYPTAAAEEPYDYRPQLGSVAPDAQPSPGRHPLILFSHGFLGASDQSIYLMERWARAGYIVAAIDHADAIKGRNSGPIKMRPFIFADRWSANTCADRREDLSALLTFLLAENVTAGSPWLDAIDPDRIGGCGHSLGGYTMLGLVGGWRDWTEPRIKAVVLWSPFLQPYRSRGEAAEVTVPVQFQGGTLDWGITPHLQPVYDQLKCTRTLLMLEGATHLEWTNLVSIRQSTRDAVAAGNPELIARYTIAFFDQHLCGADCSAVLEAAKPQLHLYRTDGAE
ncbi:MAG: hypothetical protein R3B90_05430 [Planctomycetaceae bacterium]